MKIKILISLLLAFLLALPVMALPPKGKSVDMAQTIDNTTFIDANRILMFVTNHGNFGRDLAGVFGQDYGTWFPYTGDTNDIRNNVANAGLESPYYAGGLWVGAQVGGETRVIVAEYSDEYVPGPMVDGTFLPDDPSFRVYKLYRDSMAGNPNTDYLEWPVEHGAPVDSLGNPELIGDQMCWAVFNDADPTQHINNSGLTSPLGLEVRQATFAFTREGSLGNIVVIRLRVYNKGGNTLENCYFSIWSDPDLGDAGNDFVGCDTILGLGYVYNDGPDDNQYTDIVPCLGIDFFQGPLQPGNPEDTGLMWDTIWPGFTNMGMTSFNKYINGTDPDNFNETYNYMRGLNRDGSDYIYDGQVLKFVTTGDPVANTGDLDFASADRRWMQSTGPIDFAPGDSTEIYAAIVVGLSTSDYLNSITKMKEIDNFAQKLYESGFNPPQPPAAPRVIKTELPNRIILTWNDTSEVDPGDFIFEGYTVWQGRTKSGPWTELATFDVINEFDKAMVDTIVDSYSGVTIPVVRRALTNSGLSYTYTTNEDAINGGELNDVTDYFYRVTAFSFSYFDYRDDPPSVVPNADRFLESQTVLTVTPQAPVAGEHAGLVALDTVAVEQISGASDGIVAPLITDPMAFLGDSYRVDFGTDTVAEFHDDVEITNYFSYNELLDTCDVDWDVDSILVTFCVDTVLDSADTDDYSYWDTTFNTFWNLTNTTLDSMYVERNFNISGDNNYQIFDGMQIVVSGPPLEGNSYSYASVDPPNISPVTLVEHPAYEQERLEYTGRWFTGAGDGELLFGGVYLGSNFQGSTLGADEYVPIRIDWRPLESYTDLDGSGTFTTGEPYVAGEGPDTSYAFLYSGWSGANFEGFYEIPFSAYDISDPDNPRKLVVVVRDRDQNLQWDWSYLADPPDPLLPNDGDIQYNYIWILDYDYDATGTMFDDGSSGIDFMGSDYSASNPAQWALWLGDRDVGGFLAEEGSLTLIPNYVITPADVYTFTATAPSFTSSESDLDEIKAVPNPFYLYGGYDPAAGLYAIRFHHLPAECEIKIFNLAGDLVRTIQKERDDALAEWDIITEQGLPVASGIYIYVVEAPGFGTFTGKIAVFVEDEALRVY